MNSKDAPTNTPSAQKIFDASEDGDGMDKSSQIERFEKEIENLKSQMNENKFIFVFSFVILTDIFSFPNMNTWGSPLTIGILEIVLLFVYARMCGVDDVVRFTEIILALLEKSKKN